MTMPFANGSAAAFPDSVDLIVIGAGSGGLAAALAAARLGCTVLVVEDADGIGGNAERGGVHIWEMGVGGTGIPFDLWRELRHAPRRVGVYTIGRHCSDRDPARVVCWGGENLIDPARTYADTLRRHGSPGGHYDVGWGREHWHGVVYQPGALAQAWQHLLAATGRVTIRTGTRVASIEHAGGLVGAVRLADGTRIACGAVVDGTDGFAAELAGAAIRRGREGRAEFNEPSAPEHPDERINGVTQVYRVAPADSPLVEPCDLPGDCWWRPAFPLASITTYPDGGLNVNVLPTMDGAEFLRLGRHAAQAECLRRSRAHWHWLQSTHDEFRRFRWEWAAPALGVRETRRVRTRRILTELDIDAGLSGQHDEDLVTIADHSKDVHGAHGKDLRGGELAQPYGVPFGCLVPSGLDNLLIASRAAGFSAIAASSCRLSRTMMQLGQAAGTAVALARDLGCTPSAVPGECLRAALGRQGVTLSWPMEPAIAARIAADG